jgi:hypothetical protein
VERSQVSGILLLLLYVFPLNEHDLTICNNVLVHHRSLIVGAFSDTYLKKYFSAIVAVGQHASDCLQASPLASPGTDTGIDTGTDTDTDAASSVAQMYTFTKDAATGRVLVPDIVDFFNKVTYEVLANTVLGSEWMSVMSSFGE